MQMSVEGKKKLVQTKTFWGGLATVLTGVGLVVAGDVPQGINAIATGLLAIFVRDGVRKMEPAAKKAA
jgi:hypothetical protein